MGWNLHAEEAPAWKDIDDTTLVSETGRTRYVDSSGSLTEAVADFEARHDPVPGEEDLPEGWSLERIKDLGLAPVLVTRPVTVMEYGVDDLFELSPKAILDFRGLCLVLRSEWGDWHMGQWDDPDTIACWGSYGDDLGDAIAAL